MDGLTPALKRIEVDPATADQIAATVTMMGGEDWAGWVQEAARRRPTSTGGSGSTTGSSPAAYKMV